MTISHPVVYRKRFGLLRNPAIRDEIAALDADADCQRIVHLLACYEFPFDITRCLELALFHTYGSVSVSGLLDRTGEFRKFGQKRYDDTRVLIAHFLEDGYDGGFGKPAIERMNAVHGHFQIPNDDFLFVLSTFISYPINWLGQYGCRPLTPHEQRAWFVFFRTIGQRMGIKNIPETWSAFQSWVDAYEAKNLVYADSNRHVADATIEIFAGWFPWPLKSVVKPAVCALINDKLRSAFAYPKPAVWFCRVIELTLWIRKHVKVVINIEHHPKLLSNTRNRTYPGNSYTIDGISPSYFKDGQ